MDENLDRVDVLCRVIKKMLEEYERDNMTMLFCPKCRRLQKRPNTETEPKCNVCNSDLQVVKDVVWDRK